MIYFLFVKNLEEKIQRCLQMLVGDKRLGKLCEWCMLNKTALVMCADLKGHRNKC